MPSGHGNTGPAGHPGGDLARLIATEQELETRGAEARAEARRIVQAAREASAAREAALEREIADMRAGAVAAIVRDRTTRAAGMLDDAKRDAARYQGIDPKQVERLAAHVIERLIGAT